MFHHVTIRASDPDASTRFYTTVLPTLGIEPARGGAEWGDFRIAAASPPTRGLHVGFDAPSRDLVDKFWRAGTQAGYRDDGAPGPRPQYRDDYYGAFLLDPDGNSVEAVQHGAMRAGSHIDHLWIRVADLAAAKRFYATIAAVQLDDDTPDRARFVGASSSVSLVAGTPTENLEMAFPASEAASLRDPDGNAVVLVAS